MCSLRKIQLYLIRLDGGVERDCSSLSFPSVWLVPPPEVEGEGPARSSIMVEIAPQCHFTQIRNRITHFRACAKLGTCSVFHYGRDLSTVPLHTDSERNNTLSCMRKINEKSVLLKVSLIARPFLKFEYTISVVYG